MNKHLLLTLLYYPFRYRSWNSFERYQYHLFQSKRQPLTARQNGFNPFDKKYSPRALKEQIEGIKNS